MNLSQICRLCLSNDGQIDDIFQPKGVTSLPQKIFEFTSVIIKYNQYLPSGICDICKTEIITWCKFKRQVINSNELLRIKYPSAFLCDDTLNDAKQTQTEPVLQRDQLCGSESPISSTSSSSLSTLPMVTNASNFDSNKPLRSNSVNNLENFLNLLECVQLHPKSNANDQQIILELNLPSTSSAVSPLASTSVDSTCDRQIESNECQSVSDASKSNIYKIKFEDPFNIRIESANTIKDKLRNNNNKSEEEKEKHRNDASIMESRSVGSRDIQSMQFLRYDDVQHQNCDPIKPLDSVVNVCSLIEAEVLAKNDLTELSVQNDSISNSDCRQQQTSPTGNESSSMPDGIQAVGRDKDSDNESRCSISSKYDTEVFKTIRGNRVIYSYKCNVCGQLQTNIKQHMLIHTNELPYTCTIMGCEKRFRQKQNLKRHINMHAGIKPYKCKMKNCDRKFTDSAALRSHMILHTGDRNYQCDVCKRAFGWGHTLAQHRKIHEVNRQKLYSCEHCHRQFFARNNLLKHVRIFHTNASHNVESSRNTYVSEQDDDNVRMQNAYSDRDEMNLTAIMTTTTTTTTTIPPSATQTMFECDYCKEKFQHSFYLKSHIEKHHLRFELNDTEHPKIIDNMYEEQCCAAIDDETTSLESIREFETETSSSLENFQDESFENFLMSF